MPSMLTQPRSIPTQVQQLWPGLTILESNACQRQRNSGGIARTFLNLANLVEMAKRVSCHENHILVTGHRTDGMDDAARVKVIFAGAQVGDGLFAVRGKLFERLLERTELPARPHAFRNLPLRGSVPSHLA